MPRAAAAPVMSATVPSSPGRTTWYWSRRNTGVRDVDSSSSIWGRPVRSEALVNRLTDVSLIRWASSRMRTSISFGSAAMNELKYWNAFRTRGEPFAATFRRV